MVRIMLNVMTKKVKSGNTFIVDLTWLMRRRSARIRGYLPGFFAKADMPMI
jgi:hypothetical protein